MRLVSYGFLAPPAVFVTLSLLGALIALRWRRAGLALVLTASVCLFALATPALSSYLLRLTEDGAPREIDFRPAQAIVVLGGEVRGGDSSAIPDRLGPRALERVVYAAAAHRRLGLPIAVTGGRGTGTRISEAALMKAALEKDFGIRAAWSEEHSRTTWENAVFTAQLLQPARITTVVLVSQAWHLRRAVWTFERAGLRALPWPAPRTALRVSRAEDFLPSVGALQDSFHGLHELIGGLYYRLRY